MDVEQMYAAASEEYKKNYSTGEYCHEQSFLWGFQEGVEFTEFEHKRLFIDDAKDLYNNIEKCITTLVSARLNKDTNVESNVMFNCESLLVKTQQCLQNIINTYEN